MAKKVEIAARIAELDVQEKAIKEEKDALKDLLKSKMTAGEQIQTPDGVVTKTVAATLIVDKDLESVLKEAGLYQKCSERKIVTSKVKDQAAVNPELAAKLRYDEQERLSVKRF